MSFSRISTFALALAAGLAAPVSAATLNGDVSVTFGSNKTTDFLPLTFDVLVDSSGSGSAGVTVVTEGPSGPADPSGLDDDNLIIVDNLRSVDNIDLSTIPNSAGFAEFKIARTFNFSTVGTGTTFVLFDIASTAVAKSFGAGSTATLSVFVQMLRNQIDGQFIVPDEDGNDSATKELLNQTDGGSSNAAAGGPLSVSYALDADSSYSFFVGITGSVTEVDRGSGGPDPEPEDPSVIPLPATAALLPLGLLALGAFRRRKTG